jgi:hypothetical protein
MSPSATPQIAFDKFYNIINGKQASAKQVTHGVNPATKEKLWDASIPLSIFPRSGESLLSFGIIQLPRRFRLNFPSTVYGV